MFHVFKKRQAGVTLFEVLLVLFVAAFIAAAVATIYAKVTLTFRQNQLQTGVQQLAANITATYTSATGTNYGTSDITSIVISGGLAPDEMHSGDDATNPWMTTGGWSVLGLGTSYSITLNGIPSGACSSLYQPFNKISGAATMTINTKPATDAGTALSLCNVSSSAGNTMVLFVN